MDNNIYDKIMGYVLILLAFLGPISTGGVSVLLVIGSLVMITQWLRTKTLPHIEKKMLKVIALFIVMQCIVAAFSLDPVVSFHDVWAQAYRFLPLFFAMLYLKTRKQIVGIVVAIGCGIMIDDAVAIYQAFCTGAMRPPGLNNNTLHFVIHVMMAMMILLLGIFKDYMPVWVKRLSCIALFMTLVAWFLSMSRGPSVATVIAVVVLFFSSGNKIRKKVGALLVVLFILIGAVMVSSPSYVQRMASITDEHNESNLQRLSLWKSSWYMFCDRPLLGVGQQEFEDVYVADYMIFPNAHVFGSPHNDLLVALTEGGIVGLGAFIMLHGYFLWMLWVTYKRERKSMQLSYALVGILIFICVHLSGLTDNTFSQSHIVRVYWFLLGMLLVAGNIDQREGAIGKMKTDSNAFIETIGK